MTSDELEARCVSTMGPELGPIYHRMFNRCAHLHVKWAEYCGLFGTSESRVILFNSVAPRLAWITQQALWGDILLHLARFTDDPEVSRRRRKVLTLVRLPSLVDVAIQAETRRNVRAARDAALFVRDWRNRKLAHDDLDLALNRSAEPIEPGTREQVDRSLAAVAKTLNGIEQHYLRSEVRYERRTEGEGAEGLLRCLRDGRRWRDESQERRRIGQATEADWKFEPI